MLVNWAGDSLNTLASLATRRSSMDCNTALARKGYWITPSLHTLQPQGRRLDGDPDGGWWLELTDVFVPLAIFFFLMLIHLSPVTAYLLSHKLAVKRKYKSLFLKKIGLVVYSEWEAMDEKAYDLIITAL